MMVWLETLLQRLRKTLTQDRSFTSGTKAWRGAASFVGQTLENTGCIRTAPLTKQ